MVALYVKQLGGSDKLMTATVSTAQIVMVPVALAAGRLCDSWGRKPIMAIAFLVLPLRILSYSFVTSASAVVWLQGLDGMGAGIYGVAIVAITADLTRGKGNFNMLAGLFATALAVGGVAGPLISGAVVQHLGFHGRFMASPHSPPSAQFYFCDLCRKRDPSTRKLRFPPARSFDSI
jgi:MFS family permease